MSKGFNAGIIGTGSYVPEKVITNFDMEKIVETSDEWIQTRTGIKERRVVAEGQFTSDMAAEAAKRAIEDAKLDKEDIDVIVLATMSPDYPTPATACVVQAKLGCDEIPAFDVSAACSGFIYGLSIAYGFVNSGLYKNVLVIGAEAMSRVLDWTDRSTCVLFGDGAGAAVVSRVDEGSGIKGFELGSKGEGARHLIIPAGGSVKPSTQETVASGEEFIKMEGSDVFKFAVRKMPEISEKLVGDLGMSMDEIDLMVPHQANMRIIDAASKKINIDKEKIIINLDRYGNMSAASIAVALDEAAKSGRLKKGDKALLVGFGGGLTWGACVLEWSKA